MRAQHVRTAMAIFALGLLARAPPRARAAEPSQDTVAAASAASPPAPPHDVLVVHVGTLHAGDGRVLRPGELRIEAGKLTAIATKVDAPASARRWQRPEATLTSWPIDPSVALAVPSREASGKAEVAALSACDARSPWEPWLAVLRQEGIGAICLVPETTSGISGRACTFGTDGPGEAGAPIIVEDAALSWTSGDETGSSARAAERLSMVVALEDAREADRKRHEWEAKHAKATWKPEGRASVSRNSVGGPAPLARADASVVPPGTAVLARVAAGTLPLRVRADRASDVAALLDLARDSHLTLVLTGCRECGALASRLGVAQAVVILEPLAGGGLRPDASPDPAPDPDLVRELSRAGARIAVSGGGAFPEGPRWLRLAAAELAGEGLPHDLAVDAMTSVAADAAGAGQSLGLAVGRAPRFALWEGDPLDARTAVTLIDAKDLAPPPPSRDDARAASSAAKSAP